MTEQCSALAALAQNPRSYRDDTLSNFYNKWQHDFLVVNKRFALQASSDIPGNVENVRKLLNHPSFDILNTKMIASGMLAPLTRWRHSDNIRQSLAMLGGKRVGIVGLESIGTRVAERLVLFGCAIAYNSRKRKPSASLPYYENVHDHALDSDILILCCSLTKKTRHIINKDVMTALGKEGVIINVGRGALIDEKQMVKFLVQRKLHEAGLDVFEDEPHVPAELILQDSVVLSPHRVVLTPESLEALANIVVGNLEAFFSSRPLKSPVTFE